MAIPRSPIAHSRYQTTPHLISTMKTFQIVTLFAMIAASMAFAPNAPKGEYFFGLSATKNGKKADIRLSSDVLLKSPRSVMWIFEDMHHYCMLFLLSWLMQILIRCGRFTAIICEKKHVMCLTFNFLKLTSLLLPPTPILNFSCPKGR